MVRFIPEPFISTGKNRNAMIADHKFQCIAGAICTVQVYQYRIPALQEGIHISTNIIYGQGTVKAQPYMIQAINNRFKNTIYYTCYILGINGYFQIEVIEFHINIGIRDVLLAIADKFLESLPFEFIQVFKGLLLLCVGNYSDQ